MIHISDSLYILVPSLIDAKLCNFYYVGLDIKIETVEEYLTRVPVGYRTPGALVTILLPKDGYSAGTFASDEFGTVLQNFDNKYYTFVGGLGDINFSEVILSDTTKFVMKEAGKGLSTNDYTNNEKTKLASLQTNIYLIALPKGNSVLERCAGAVQGIDYPNNWTITKGTNPLDLLITHNLDRRITDVKIYSVDESGDRLLYANAAYAGVTAISRNQLLVLALSTVPSPLVIHLIFS